VSTADLAIMRRLDRLHLEFPFAGSRMLRGLLAAGSLTSADAPLIDAENLFRQPGPALISLYGRAAVVRAGGERRNSEIEE
jgi:hypothetical protein